MFLWKIIKEIAVLGPTAQFAFWAFGVLDRVTKWLKEENHWIFFSYPDYNLRWFPLVAYLFVAALPTRKAAKARALRT